jgi:hyperosmotically inducible protein
MKTFNATLLAAAMSAAFSMNVYANDTKPDTATYKTVTQKAAADYKVAAAKCAGMTGTEKSACIEEAKVARARVDLDAVGQYNNTLKARIAARTALAKAEHALARVKCSLMTGAEKDSCLSTADSVRTAALADAKADRNVRVAGFAAGTVESSATTDPVKAAAIDKCAQVAGQPNTGCLIDNKDRSVANAAANTRDAAASAVEKTKGAAATVAGKTERAIDRMDVADTTRGAAARTGKVVADSVITTKVKADLFKEPELSAMAIHVETEKGVVMLSGFVDSKADADKAVRLAKSVEGVNQVKSAIKVK